MCSNKTRVLLGFFNLVFLTFGIAVVGVAAWGIKHVSEFKGIINDGAVPTAEAAGVLLIVVSALGFLGVILTEHKFGRFLLGLYNLLVFVLIAVTLAGAGLVIVFANKIKEADVSSRVNNTVNNWINKVYNECCVAGVVQDCAFKELITAADCRGGPAAFQKTVQDFVKAHFVPIAGLLFAAAVFQLLTVIMACVVSRRGKRAQLLEEEQKRREEEQRQRGAVYQAPVLVVVPNPHNRPAVAADHRF